MAHSKEKKNIHLFSPGGKVSLMVTKVDVNSLTSIKV